MYRWILTLYKWHVSAEKSKAERGIPYGTAGSLSWMALLFLGFCVFCQKKKVRKKKKKKRPYCVVVKSASLGTLEMNCVTVTFALLAYAVRRHLVACARAHTSQITCVAGHYKGRGSWKCSCKSTSAGLFLGRMEAFPLQHPELCITSLQNCVSLLNQSLGKAEARWLASWLIKARRL